MSNGKLELFLEFGHPGDLLPGSRFVRDYCSCCGEPIRVNKGDGLGGNVCNNCSGRGEKSSKPTAYVYCQGCGKRIRAKGAIRPDDKFCELCSTYATRLCR